MIAYEIYIEKLENSPGLSFDIWTSGKLGLWSIPKPWVCCVCTHRVAFKTQFCICLDMWYMVSSKNVVSQNLMFFYHCPAQVLIIPICLKSCSVAGLVGWTGGSPLFNKHKQYIICGPQKSNVLIRSIKIWNIQSATLYNDDFLGVFLHGFVSKCCRPIEIHPNYVCFS